MFLLFLCASGSVGGEESGRSLFAADYTVYQFAGQIGYLSGGVGKYWKDGRVETDLLLGYAPEVVAGEDIYAVAIKARRFVTPKRIAENQLTAYIGLGVNYYMGEQYAIKSQFQDNYYPYSQWHLMPSVGVKVKSLLPGNEGNALYIEAGILDQYLIHYFNNRSFLDLSDVISLSIALSIEM